MTQPRISWPEVLQQAARIVRSYDTGVTLRQLFYRLVANETLPNTEVAYRTLSARSAEARRAKWFPPLIDRNRAIYQYDSHASPLASLDANRWAYRRDRTKGQPYAVYLAVEKAGIVNQLDQWFADPLGLPVLALGGYSSQTYCDEIVEHVRDDGRPAVLLYAGDYDPSGEDIDRDLKARTGCWDTFTRVALTKAQVATYSLPVPPYRPRKDRTGRDKKPDSRAKAFHARNGELVQVEVDALDPNDLRALYQDALRPYWDTSAYEAVMAQEADDIELLDANRAGFAAGLEDDSD